jgi:hypothetical protein
VTNGSSFAGFPWRTAARLGNDGGDSRAARRRLRRWLAGHNGDWPSTMARSKQGKAFAWRRSQGINHAGDAWAARGSMGGTWPTPDEAAGTVRAKPVGTRTRSRVEPVGRSLIRRQWAVLFLWAGPLSSFLLFQELSKFFNCFKLENTKPNPPEVKKCRSMV